MEKISISTAEAKQDKLFYVVANIVIVNSEDQTCLLLKRSENEKVLPGKWALPGGKLEHGDVAALLEQTGNAPIDGINGILGILAAREAKEECGLEVDPGSAIILSDKVFVRPDGVPVFMVSLATKYTGGTATFEEGAFTDVAWVREDEFGNYDCIESVPDEARAALANFA
jgi:ADP-ribose pyrophosphatase YjhB (NUDIX family)